MWKRRCRKEMRKTLLWMWNINWKCTQPNILIKPFYTRTASQPINHSISRVTTRRQFPVEAKLSVGSLKFWKRGQNTARCLFPPKTELGLTEKQKKKTRMRPPPVNTKAGERVVGEGELEMTGEEEKEPGEWWASGKSFIPIIKVQNFIGQLSNHLSVLFRLFRRN